VSDAPISGGHALGVEGPWEHLGVHALSCAEEFGETFLGRTQLLFTAKLLSNGIMNVVVATCG